MTSENDAFELKDRLLDKSIEAYVLALETVNRLTIRYRLESFCFLLCNAWELMLKSKLIHDSGDDESAYYPETEAGEKRSLSLSDCLNRLLPNENDPVRKNIERIRDLRDESVHLVIGDIPTDLIALFQAGVTNYHRLLNDWFEESLANRHPVPMMSIVYDMDPGRHDLTDARLRSRLGAEAFEYLSRFSSQLATDHEAMGRPEEFLVTVRHAVYLTKREADADITLTSGPGDGEMAHVLEVAKDSSVTHPYRRKELVANMREFYPGASPYDVQSVNAVHKVKSRNEWYYQGKVKGSPGQYSQLFLDWLKNRFHQDSRFFETSRQRYSQQLRARRRRTRSARHST